MRTDITTDEAREVLWASSPEGMAQLSAAWERAVAYGMHDKGLTQADVGALLWAAHEARPGDLPDDANPRRIRMRQIIAEAGQDGADLRLVFGALVNERLDVQRETLRRWACDDTEAGLLEQFDGEHGRTRWRVKR